MHDARLAALLALGLALSSSGARAEGAFRLPVLDPHAAARAHLAEGRYEEVLRALGDTGEGPPPLLSAPALYARALIALGEGERALAVLRADAEAHPERADAAARGMAKALFALGRKDEAAERWLAVLDGGWLAKDPLILDEALAQLRAAGREEAALSALLRAGVFELEKPVSAPRREALARVLRFVAERAEADEKARAIRRLYVDLGETKAAEGALRLAEPAQREALLRLETALARARVLTDRHDNAGVFETLKPHRPRARDDSAAACEVRFLLGKASRKLRRYQSARKDLDYVASRCQDPWRKKARYLAALIASFGDPKRALASFDAFLEAYPEDSLSDDVLLWKAEALERLGQRADAEAAFRALLSRFPDGDMRERARFSLALLLARRGDVPGARAILDEVARTAQAAPPDVRDRALYWRARLLVFPELSTLEPTRDEERRAEGIRALLSLAAARPASYYGHLARLLARHAQEAIGAPAALIEEALRTSDLLSRAGIAGENAIQTSPALAEEPRFRAALALATAGYDEEAELLLDGIDAGALAPPDRLAVMLLYAQVGAPDKSHRVMRFTQGALLEGRPTDASLLTWVLAYPRAHEYAIKKAAEKAKIPEALLFGLAREESAFEASAVSWAGAIGLCQLMPSTAKEEAARLKIELPSLEALRDPMLNARLGAEHLSRRMRLGHPLLAIAAYNAGPNNVNKWRKTLKVQALDAFVEAIPIEQTRRYVKKVTGSWVTYAALDGRVDDVAFSMLLP